MHLELNEGPTDFDTRHNFVVSGTGARAAHGRAERELGRAGAERLAVQPDQRATSIPICNGIQAEPLPAGDYSGTGTDPYTVKDYKSRAQRRARSRVLQRSTCGSATSSALADRRRVEVFGRRVQPDEPHELRESDRQPGVDAVPAADGVQHELRAAQGADRRAVRVLSAGWSAPAIAAGSGRSAAAARSDSSVQRVSGPRARELADSRLATGILGTMRPAFRRLLPYVLRYRRAFLLGLICVVLSRRLQLLSPWVLKYAIDDLDARRHPAEARHLRGAAARRRRACARCSGS